MKLRSIILLPLLLCSLGVNSVESVNNSMAKEFNRIEMQTPKVYVHPNYKGNRVNLWCTEPNLKRHGWNDQFSSCTVPSGWTLVFYEHPGFRGHTFTVSGNVQYFSDYGWNDKVSSVAAYYNGTLQQNCTWSSRNSSSNQRKRKYEPDYEPRGKEGKWD